MMHSCGTDGEGSQLIHIHCFALVWVESIAPSDDVVVRYVLQVLWMMSYFHIMEHIQMKDVTTIVAVPDNCLQYHKQDRNVDFLSDVVCWTYKIFGFHSSLVGYSSSAELLLSYF